MFANKLICNSIVNALNIEGHNNEYHKDGEYETREDGFTWVFKPNDESNITSIEIKDEPFADKHGRAIHYPQRYVKITANSLTPAQVQGLQELFGRINNIQYEDNQIIIKENLIL